MLALAEGCGEERQDLTSRSEGGIAPKQLAESTKASRHRKKIEIAQIGVRR